MLAPKLRLDPPKEDVFSFPFGHLWKREVLSQRARALEAAPGQPEGNPPYHIGAVV